MFFGMNYGNNMGMNFGNNVGMNYGNNMGMNFGNNMGMNFGNNMGMNMNNQIDMMNIMRMNFMLNMMNQNMNNNNNNNSNFFMANQPNMNMNGKNAIGGILPRKVGTEQFDPFPNQIITKYNITFESSAGYKLVIFTPINITVKELLKIFIRKAGLYEGVIGNQIKFIFNALYVDPSEKRTINEFGMTDFSKILVIDSSNLLGGKKNN